MRVLRVPGTVPALVYILTVSELVSVRVCVCPCVPCGVVGVVRTSSKSAGTGVGRRCTVQVCRQGREQGKCGRANVLICD